MSGKFINDEFEKSLRINVVNMTFPNLNNKHRELLTTYLYGLVQMIAICYDFYNDRDNFINKLKQNSFKDLRWLLTFLLPYIERTSISKLTDLNDLYVARYDVLDSETKSKLHSLSGEKEDINFVSPRYVFSNIQYGRCVRNGYGENKSIAFNESFIEENYYLLLNTILTTRNKLYVNWIDVVPYRLDNFTQSNLYAQTQQSIQTNTIREIDPVIDYPVISIKDEQQIKLLREKIGGLSIEDIYNTISIDLYESVVYYKWLLFDIGITGKNGVIIQPLLHILNAVFTLRNIFNESEWDTLVDSVKNRFIREFDVIKMAYQKAYDMGNDTVMINANAVKTLVKSFVVFFDKRYSKTRLFRESKYVPLTRSALNIDDYDERMVDVTDEMIIKTLNSIDYVHAYSFLLESIQGFKKTWYSYHMLTPDKTKLSDKVSYKSGLRHVTFKNIYNFCKSLVHEKKQNKQSVLYSEEYSRLPRLWAELDDKTKRLVIDRLNNVNSNWFDIRRNMYHVMKLADSTIDRNAMPQILSNMAGIYSEIRQNLTNVLFEASICKGTLSFMIAETDLTNNDVYDMSQPSHKATFVSKLSERRFYNANPYGANSYYYLTEKPYNATGNHYIKVGDKLDTYDYFKICSTVSTAWYVATTYHWIAQIGFCHKFINNRVNFITGGTGAGKSTQIPKMYMYYLKAIDRLSSPTVVVTVPRTNVATGVSNFVSQELAVPYQEYDKNTNKEAPVRNNNFYVQFKYMSDEHVDEGVYPKIRFITDGSVLQDAKDPLFKNKRYLSKQNQFIYLKENRYDVVIVDEAHEHNANMDMILTLMRNGTYYNNKLRLVIMSATMDSDEPVYRRFYRDVNDNRKYPLSSWIQKHSLDRINTERRFHISPPDETTRFKITEIYRPGENPNDLVINIIKESISGDILMFHPGTKDINESVKLLNAPNVLPHDVIALPYHAQLPDQIKRFLDRIDKTLKDLRIDKQRDLSTAASADLITGTNHYTRCILVATNIAEASISISTLKYVVETGLEKTMKFDFERRTNILTSNYITDASRLQRKGRVGRVAPGTVYYTYKEGSLTNNVKQFNMAVQDIHQSVLLDMLRDPTDVPIFNELLNSLVSGFNLNKILTDRISKYEFNTDVKSITKEQLLKLLIKDYTEYLEQNQKFDQKIFIVSLCENIVDHYGTYEYVGNQSYDYVNSKMPFNTYLSGFDKDQLTDSLGEFYIVHPDELTIKRNINGEIVSTDNYSVSLKKSSLNKIQYMISNKMIVFWETLLNSGYIGIRDNTLFKTRFGEILKHCSTGFVFKDELLVNMLVYGYGLSKTDEEFDQVLSVVTMLNIMGIEPATKLIDHGMIDRRIEKLPDKEKKKLKKLLENDAFTQIKNNNVITSDIQIILSVDQLIHKLFEKSSVKLNLYKSQYVTSGKFLGENVTNIEKGLNEANTLRYTKKDIAKRNELMSAIVNFHKRDIATQITTYERFLKNIGLDIIVIKKFITDREEIRRLWSDVFYDIKNTGDAKNIDVSELKTILSEHRVYMDKLNIDLLKGVILLSKPYNIKQKILNTSSSYLALYNPHSDTISTLSPNSTFVDPPFYQEFILNLNENLEYKTISLILNITVNDLKLIANIYSKQKSQYLSEEKKRSHILKYTTDTYPNEQQENLQILLKSLDERQKNQTTNFDYRTYTVPEHILAISNFNKTLESRPTIDNQISSIIKNKLN